MMHKLFSLLFLLFMSVSTAYAEKIKSSHEVTLSSGELVTISEGLGEPQSIGSYGLRVYSIIDSKYPYDNFTTGIILTREGVVEKAAAYDVDKDGDDEIVVIVRSVGTGSYISARAFKYNGKTLSVLISLDGLDKDIDPVQSLESAFNKASNPTP